MTFRLLPAFVGALLIVHTSLWARSMVITDRIEVGLRSGIGIEQRIISTLKTGDRVEVLEGDRTWSKVRLPNGTVGWLATSFLVESVRPQVPLVDPKIQEELRGLKEANQNLVKQLSDLHQERERLLKEREDGKRPISTHPQEKNRPLPAEVAQLKAKNEQLEKEILFFKKQGAVKDKEPGSGQHIQWFLAGSGVLFLGLVLGWVMNRGRRKPSRYY